ncbi:MAG: hypothetical protein IT580_20050 [Verrucomicrobiales bacterium]|nr:hypothetical protein [Verrucomicrobiales bacterium]
MQPTLNSHRSSFLKRSRAALALGGLAAFSLSAQVQAVTIDFSTAPTFNTDLPWSEKGFTLSKLSGGAFVRGDYGGVNPSPVLMLGNQGGSVRLTRTDNGLFDLKGLEVDHFPAPPTYHPARLEISTGHTVGITLEGTYIFSGYEGLSWLDIIFEVPAATSPSDWYNLLIDNIVVKNSVSNVPDAGSTGLLLSGALGVFGLWQQRLRRL